MPEPAIISQLRRELLRQGCPPKAAQKILRETAEHFEDLQQAELARGVTLEEAVARAGERLGNPKELAKNKIAAIRTGTFLGRRSRPFGLILFPIFFWSGLFSASLFSAYWLRGLVSQMVPSILENDSGIIMALVLGPIMDAIIVLGLFGFNHLTQNACFSLKARTFQFGVMAFGALFKVEFWPLVLIYHLPYGWADMLPNWDNAQAAALPALVGLLVYLRYQRQVQRLSTSRSQGADRMAAKSASANPAIKKLRWHLLELGCPVSLAHRIVRETTEHHQDLQKAALARGSSVWEARAEATTQLGDLRQLAERHIEVVRATSAWSRLPLFYFGFLPVSLILVSAVACISLNGGEVPVRIINLLEWLNKPWIFLFLQPMVNVTVCGALALFTYYFCHKAKRLALGRPVIWLTGGLLAILGLFLHISPSIHSSMHLIHKDSVRESMDEYKANTAPAFTPANLARLDAEWDQQEPKPSAVERLQMKEIFSQEVNHQELPSDYPSPFSLNWQIAGIAECESNYDDKCMRVELGPYIPGSKTQEPHQWALVIETHDVYCPIPAVQFAWPTWDLQYSLPALIFIGTPLLVAFFVSWPLRRQMIPFEPEDQFDAIPS